MAQLNTRTTTPAPVTHGGVQAARINAVQQLRRTVMACMLWEDTFYENGVSIADRIVELVAQVPADLCAGIAVEARIEQNLRHAPLLICAAMAKSHKGIIVSETIARVVQRADELNEFMAIYWRNGKTPVSKQVRIGLRKAFENFDAYQLAKYNRDKDVTLRDVAFLVHPKPGKKQMPAETVATRVPAISKGKYKRGEVDRHPESLLAKLISDTLPTPDTWEAGLSAGKDKGETFNRLLDEGKLGYFALLRNLRNMTQAGVSDAKIGGAILARKGGAEKVLPFRYIAAARAVPQFEPQLDGALQAAVAEMPVLPGKTVILVDVSISMHAKLSDKSDLTRMDAAAALASIVPAEHLRVFTFSDRHVEVPPRKGMAGVDAIINSQHHSSTDLVGAVRQANNLTHDRLIVITDEQATSNWGGPVPAPVAKLAYLINVASYKNGVGYGNGWTHIDGFSEATLKWMAANERSDA